MMMDVEGRRRKGRPKKPPPWPSGQRLGTLWPCLKLRCAEGCEFEPRPGQYSRMSFFHPTRWLERFSLIWTSLSFQILNLFRTLSSWGSVNYSRSATFLYDIEVASHIKKLPFRPYIKVEVTVRFSECWVEGERTVGRADAYRQCRGILSHASTPHRSMKRCRGRRTRSLISKTTTSLNSHNHTRRPRNNV